MTELIYCGSSQDQLYFYVTLPPARFQQLIFILTTKEEGA